MTPNEKARALVDYFLRKKPVKLDEQLVVEHPTAVEFAKKVVDEAWNSVVNEDINKALFWVDVEEELEKM